VADCFKGWPKADTAEGPRHIYVMNVMPTEGELLELEGKGYVLTDVRTIKNRTEAVKATLQGITEGTILPMKDAFKYIELEAKTLGLTAPKQVQQKTDKPLVVSDIDTILKGIDTRGIEQNAIKSDGTAKKPRTKLASTAGETV
jgi:hypothetical protein